MRLRLPLRYVGITVPKLRGICGLIHHWSTSHEWPLVAVPAAKSVAGSLQRVVQWRSPACIRKRFAVAAVHHAADETFAIAAVLSELTTPSISTVGICAVGVGTRVTKTLAIGIIKVAFAIHVARAIGSADSRCSSGSRCARIAVRSRRAGGISPTAAGTTSCVTALGTFAAVLHVDFANLTDFCRSAVRILFGHNLLDVLRHSGCWNQHCSCDQQGFDVAYHEILLQERFRPLLR